MTGGAHYVPPAVGESWWVVGDTYIFKVTGEDTGGTLAFFEATVPAQGGPPPHIHSGEDEFYYLLDGSFEIQDGDRTFVAEPRSFVFLPRGHLHAFRNVSATPARMLIGITPAGFERFFFSVGQPAISGQQAPPLSPDEIVRTLEAAPQYGLELRLPSP